MSRAEERRLMREARLAPRVAPQVPKLREVRWALDAQLVSLVRDGAKAHGTSEVHFATLLLGAGLEVYREQVRKQNEKDNLVQIATTMPPARRSAGALLGGRG